MKIRTDDPRLTAPQCTSLTPVKIIHENQWFAVRNRGGFFTTEYRYPQVIVLPIVDNCSIVMVRARRPVIEDITFELPAGSAKENETPMQAADRELGEETGIEIKDLNRFKLLTPISNSPNRNPQLLHVFQIYLKFSEYDTRTKHDHEVDGVKCFSFEEIQKMIVSGEIYVSIPMAVIGRFFCSINKI